MEGASSSMRMRRSLSMMVLVVAAWMVAEGEAAITCGTVRSQLSPCIPYTTGKAAAPSSGCCNGVRNLYSVTKSSKPDRITSCGCIKKLATALGNSLNPSRISDLPGKCGVNLGYSISVNTNCATIP